MPGNEVRPRQARPYGGPVITCEWRGAFTDAEVSALHAEGFGGQRGGGDWLARVERLSLGWVCARDGAELAGFVNVAWDGACHASTPSLPGACGGREWEPALLPSPPSRPAPEQLNEYRGS